MVSRRQKLGDMDEWHLKITLQSKMSYDLDKIALCPKLTRLLKFDIMYVIQI